ncbi:TPA: hypothetical protein RG862_003532 [Enterobacter ludwigii]|uniref:hypothetical protein n=1 Tax=Enterobacter asburiae TaxID=61645 RepID=UPI0028134F44|nr:hypothetical protein [Enterobacter asburiae]EMA4739446.1 hypothetical protein [Enterobacter asburiae]HDU8904274.1 hypothetical protein [Enterobacter ludwigii]
MQKFAEAVPDNTPVFFPDYIPLRGSIVQDKRSPPLFICGDFHFDHVQAGMIHYEVI